MMANKRYIYLKNNKVVESSSPAVQKIYREHPHLWRPASDSVFENNDTVADAVIENTSEEPAAKPKLVVDNTLEQDINTEREQKPKTTRKRRSTRGKNN